LDIVKVNKMYELVEKKVLDIPSTTPTERKRREHAMVWSTILREGWAKKRSKPTPTADAEEREDNTDNE